MLEQIIHVVPVGNKELQALESSEHEFLMSSHDVAQGYGVSTSALRSNKNNHTDELIEGKHFISVQNIDANPRAGIAHTKTMWTKKGIVRLGFFIKSQEAKQFRDWAEDYIIKSGSDNNSSQMMALMQQQNKILMTLIQSQNEKINQIALTQERYIFIRQENRATTITAKETDEIVKLIHAAAKPVARYHNLDEYTTRRMIFGKFNDRFGISKYYHLKAVDYPKAKNFIKQMETLAGVITNPALKMMIDEIIDPKHMYED